MLTIIGIVFILYLGDWTRPFDFIGISFRRFIEMNKFIIFLSTWISKKDS